MWNKKLFSIVLCALLLILITPSANAFGYVKADVDDNTAKAQVLMEYGTGEILTEKNSKQHLPIASVTKLMTLLLALEAIDNGVLSLDQNLTASENAAGMGGSQVFIDPNAEYKVENLLHAIIISSANDASVVIAEAIGGSEQGFVTMMNERAKALGANDTNYGNATGLPCANAYSCANDIALIMKEVLKHKHYFDISKIWMEDFEHPSGRITQMANTNKLLRTYNGCDAGKTGSTNEAGFCMSATAKRGNMRLIAVVLGAESSKDRFGACSSLFDWGFANYTSEKIIDSEKALDIDIDISQAKDKIQVCANEDYYALSKKGEKPNLVLNYETLDDLKAPLKKGEVVGKIIITEDNVVVKELNIVAMQDVEAKTFKDNFDEILQNWALKK